MATSDEIADMLEAVSKSSRTDFEQLYSATSAKLYGVMLRILRRHELAAQVMEDCYLQIWQTAKEYDPTVTSPLAWMVAIGRRRAIDLMRRADPATDDGEPEIEDSDGPGSVPRRELTDELKRLLTCIGRLEPERQRMLLLAYYGAFSREELSAKLGVPTTLLRGMLRRSLSEIEQCLTS
jgi:RNA polymerase sigma-70 factor (ECF subfamily)